MEIGIKTEMQVENLWHSQVLFQKYCLLNWCEMQLNVDIEKR